MLASAGTVRLRQPEARQPCSPRDLRAPSRSGEAGLRPWVACGLLAVGGAAKTRPRLVRPSSTTEGDETSVPSPEEVMEVWKKYYRIQRRPEHVCLDEVASAIATTGTGKWARSVVDRAHVWRVDLDTKVYRDLLEGCQRSAEDSVAVSILKCMREIEVTPDVAMYEAAATAVTRGRRTLIQSVITSRQPRKKDLERVTDEQLSELFDEMLEDLRQDPENFSDLRRALLLLAKSDRLDQAEAFFEEVRRALPDEVAQDAMAAPYAAKGCFLEATRYAHTSLTGLRAAMEGWLQGGKPGKALELLSSGRAKQLAADPVAYETAVKCCLAVGKTEWLYRLCSDSYKALGQLLASDTPLEEQYEAYRACARSWAAAGNWAFSLQLLQTMDPTLWGASTHSTILKACLQYGATSEAEALFASLLKRGEEPDARAYHVMMMHYLRLEDLAKAESLYKAAVESGLCPDWDLRKNSMSVVGLDKELAAMALRIFMMKWRLNALQKSRVSVTLDILIRTSPQAGVESLRSWASESQEEKEMQHYLCSILQQEFGLTAQSTSPGELLLLKLDLARYLGIAGKAKTCRTSVNEKANELSYRPPDDDDFD